jgi:hypothetical protein
LFLFEATGITLFSVYWILKTVELWFSGAEKMAVLGFNPNEVQEAGAMGLQAERLAVTGLELVKVIPELFKIIEDHKKVLADLADLAEREAPVARFIEGRRRPPHQADRLEQVGQKLIEIVQANKNNMA